MVHVQIWGTRLPILSLTGIGGLSAPLGHLQSSFNPRRCFQEVANMQNGEPTMLLLCVSAVWMTAVLPLFSVTHSINLVMNQVSQRAIATLP